MALQPVDEMDRDDKLAHIENRLVAGQELTRQQIADEYDVSPSTAGDYLREELGGRLPLQHERDGREKVWYVEDAGYRKVQEFADDDDIAQYVADTATGRREELAGDAWEEEARATIAYGSELGMGTLFWHDAVEDGLQDVFAEKLGAGHPVVYGVDEETLQDGFALALNGGVNPFVSRRSFKTARQYHAALGYVDIEEDENGDLYAKASREQLRHLLEEEIHPDDEAAQEQFLEEFFETFDVDGKRKITSLWDVTGMMEEMVDGLYDVAGEEFPLYYHQGEQDRKNIEELTSLKIRELSDDLSDERLDILEEVIDKRVSTLTEAKDMVKGSDIDIPLEELEERIETAERYQDQLDEMRDELEELSSQSTPDREKLDEYQDWLDSVEFADMGELVGDTDGLEEIQDDLSTQREQIQKMRESQLNLAAMYEEMAYGSFAENFGWVQLDPAQSTHVQKLAEQEYEEYIHPWGNIQDIGTDSELMEFEVGDFTVAMAHDLGVAGDEPKKYGFSDELEHLKQREDWDDADLALFTHHGTYGIYPLTQGLQDEADDITWTVNGSTLMDESLLERFGLDEGHHLLKEVKAANKGLFDSTFSFIDLIRERGPDGQMRTRIRVEGYGQEELKGRGLQARGKEFPGVDFEDRDPWYAIIRGDDQFGAAHDLDYLQVSTIQEVFREEMANIEDYLADRDVDDDVWLIDGGDMFQGDDKYEGQKTEGSMEWGSDWWQLIGDLVAETEDLPDEAVGDIETETDLYELLLSRDDWSGETTAAVLYLTERNRQQVNLNSTDDQGQLVNDVKVRAYQEILDDPSVDRLVVSDGDHYNDNAEGNKEARRLKRMFDDEYQDDIVTGSGIHEGDQTLSVWGDNGTDPLDVRVVHTPKGRGGNEVEKMGSAATQPGTDVEVNHNYHVPATERSDGVTRFMPGSAQGFTKYVKGISDTPHPAGGIFVATDRNPDRDWFVFEHVQTDGVNPIEMARQRIDDGDAA